MNDANITMSTNSIEVILETIPAERFLSNLVILAILALIILGATLIDMADALVTARRLKQPIQSHGLRKTVAKLSEYWRVLTAGFLADSVCCFVDFYELPYGSISIALGLVVIEIRSLLEHAEKRQSGIKDLPDVIDNLTRIHGER